VAISGRQPCVMLCATARAGAIAGRQAGRVSLPEVWRWKLEAVRERRSSVGKSPVRIGCTRRPTSRGRSDHESFDADKVGRRVRLRALANLGTLSTDRDGGVRSNCRTFSPIRRCPAARRRQLVVAEAEDGQAFWVEGAAIRNGFKLTGRTIRRLQWRWKRL